MDPHALSKLKDVEDLGDPLQVELSFSTENFRMGK